LDALAADELGCCKSLENLDLSQNPIAKVEIEKNHLALLELAKMALQSIKVLNLISQGMDPIVSDSFCRELPSLVFFNGNPVRKRVPFHAADN
jgi:hypothetical protein